MIEEKYYVTKQGFKKIEKDYQALLAFKKKKATGDEVPNSWHSEEVNPEYLSFQEDISLLETRLIELENILKNIEIIKTPRKEMWNEILIGATVTLKDKDGAFNEYTILGSLESNPAEGKISSDSPVGRALLGKKVNEEAIITSPIRVVYTIEKIVYSPHSA